MTFSTWDTFSHRKGVSSVERVGELQLWAKRDMDADTNYMCEWELTTDFFFQEMYWTYF
jgi:hypothetical protein